MADLKAALEGEDAEAIQAKTQTLTQASMKLGEAMYKAQAGDAEGAKREAADDGVVDAEFEEVADDRSRAEAGDAIEASPTGTRRWGRMAAPWQLCSDIPMSGNVAAAFA